MPLTARLKKWLVENCDVKAIAEDDEFRKAAGEAMAKSEGEKGFLSIEKYTELSTTKENKQAEEFQETQKGILDALSKITEALKPQKKTTEELEANNKDEKEKAEKEIQEKAAKRVKEIAATKKAEEEAEKEAKKAAIARKKKEYVPSKLEKMVVAMGGTPDEEEGEEKNFDVRVKEAAEMYTDTKSAMIYPEESNSKGVKHHLAGQPVKDFFSSAGGRVMDSTSELDQAVIGAWGKFMVNAAKTGSRSLGFMHLPSHDKELIVYAMTNMKWSGSSDGGEHDDIRNRKLTSLEQKQLIDDAASGGIEAAPIVFDDDVIQTPLLHGELFPLTNKVPITRGRRIEGVVTGTVTGGWGGIDATAIALFNTAAYVTAFDTTIFRWEGAIRIGLDFLSDTPIDFGQHISAQYGERLLEDLDDVVATGDGTTQPEGVMNKAGTTSIAFGAATTIGNYESLRFGVAKPEHRQNLLSTAVYCGTETSYQRVRGIPVGATDARRLFGNDHFGPGAGGYQFGTGSYRINESLTNAQIFYAILGRYRMYVRKGLTIRTSTEGASLIRGNEMLMVAMARYGGQLERGATAAITTTGEI